MRMLIICTLSHPSALALVTGEFFGALLILLHHQVSCIYNSINRGWPVCNVFPNDIILYRYCAV